MESAHAGPPAPGSASPASPAAGGSGRAGRPDALTQRRASSPLRPHFDHPYSLPPERGGQIAAGADERAARDGHGDGGGFGEKAEATAA